MRRWTALTGREIRDRQSRTLRFPVNLMLNARNLHFDDREQQSECDVAHNPSLHMLQLARDTFTAIEAKAQALLRAEPVAA